MRKINWRNLPIPLTGGLDEASTEFIRPATSLLTLKNARWEKTGEIAKRHGFTPMAADVINGSAPSTTRGIFSTGKELCLLGPERLYSYSPTLTEWIDRGPISPFCGKATTAHSTIYEHNQSDHAESDAGYIAVASRFRRETDDNTAYNDNTEYGIRVSVTGASEENLFASLYYAGEDSLTEDIGYACGVSTASGKLLLWTVHAAAGADPQDWHLVRREHSDSSPGNWMSATTIATDMRKLAFRVFDADEDSAGGYNLAYIDTSFDIQLVRYDSDGTSLATDSITGSFNKVAIAVDQDNDDNFYVLCVDDSGESEGLVLYHRDKDGAAIWGPVTLATANSLVSTDFINIGVVATADDAICTWGYFETGPLNSTHARSVDQATQALGDVEDIHNALPMSKPWLKDGNTYVGARSTSDIYPFDSNVVLKLDQPFADGESEGYTLAGVFHPGSAPAVSNYPQSGNGCRVSSSSELRRYTAEHATFSNVVYDDDPAYPSAWGQATEVDDTRAAVDLVTLDYGAIPTATVTSRGSAIVGGGVVTHYDGLRCVESGFVHPPVIYGVSSEAFTGGTLSPGDTAIHYGMWTSIDASGALHRSLPSQPVTGTVDTLEDTLSIQVRSLGVTNRRLTEPFSWELYAVGDDTVAGRLNASQRFEPNIYSAHTCGVLRNWGQDQDANGNPSGPPLYIEGGELGASIPEGARLVTQAMERIWLADHYRRERVSWSKTFKGRGIADYEIAPEFSEGFVLTIPDGEEITAMGELDDKLVVFTATTVYLLAGRGPDDAGRGNDFSQLSPISSDGGCIEARSLVSFPGGLFFQSPSGIQLLDRGLSVSFVGQPVKETLDAAPTIVAAMLDSSENRVLFVTTSAVLVFDYRVKAWTVWEPLTSLGANLTLAGGCMHNDVPHLVTATGEVWQHDSTTHLDDTTQWVPLDIEVGWIEVTGPLGWSRIREVALMADKKTDHDLNVDTAINFSSTALRTVTFDSTTLADVADRMNPVVRFKTQRQQAFKVRIYDSEPASGVGTGAGFAIAGIMAKIGAKEGTHKRAGSERS